MVWIVYQLKFSDGTYYIGQTSDLNDRVFAHRSIWKVSHDLDIVNVKILDFANNQDDALKLEKHFIRHSDTSELRNVAEMDARCRKTHILNPTELMHSLNMRGDTQKRILLRNEIRKLENRYIRTWTELQRMQDNIKYLDVLVDQAVNEALDNELK